MKIALSGPWLTAVCALALLSAGGRVEAQPHVGEYPLADVQKGSQLFSTRCTTCHGDAGDQVPGVRVLSGQYRRASSDEELAALIKNGIPAAGMPQGNYSDDELKAFVAYLRSASVVPVFRGDNTAVSITGNPERGRAVFQGKGKCITCHRVNGVGSFRGPNLSEIGAVRSPQSLVQSLVSPSAEIIPLNQEITVVTRQGQTISGRRMNEDTYSIQLILEEQGRLVSVLKSNVKTMTVTKESPMPSYRDTLSPDELADTLAFLRTLTPVD
jgi:putative heme-binding domain-containing protein